MAQMEFSYAVKWWHDVQCVHFRTYFYVPERHPDSKQLFHEREDAGHVFKINIIT